MENYQSAYWQSATPQQIWDEMKRNPASMNELLPLFPININTFLRKAHFKYLYLRINKYNKRDQQHQNRILI